MIHRAMLGSIERFIGILIEHFAGAFPAWLAPVQVAVLPITDRAMEHGHGVTARLKTAGFRAIMDARSEKIGAKIRDAQLQKILFMLVLGDREVQDKTVSVRHRSDGDRGVMGVEAFEVMLRDLVTRRAL
jgi:threonyl-tRNA synthetase